VGIHALGRHRQVERDHVASLPLALDSRVAVFHRASQLDRYAVDRQTWRSAPARQPQSQPEARRLLDRHPQRHGAIPWVARFLA
jgi:hypothetical protein